MRVHSSTRFAAIAALVGALACAGNTAREGDMDESAAARDTTTSDTLGGQENPAGYQGMERDTTIAPAGEEATDSFLQKQGTGQAQDTSGYAGMERTDTTGQAQSQTDTTGQAGDVQSQTDTTSATGAASDSAGAWGADTSGMNQGDTTGYDPSQQQTPSDTTSR